MRQMVPLTVIPPSQLGQSKGPLVYRCDHLGTVLLAKQRPLMCHISDRAATIWSAKFHSVMVLRAKLSQAIFKSVPQLLLRGAELAMDVSLLLLVTLRQRIKCLVGSRGYSRTQHQHHRGNAGEDRKEDLTC